MQYSFENIFTMKDMHSNSIFFTETISEPIASVEFSEQPDQHEQRTC